MDETATATRKKDHGVCCSTRFGIALIGTCGFACLYSMRFNLSVALVCMLNHTAIQLNHNSHPDFTEATNRTQYSAVEKCIQRNHQNALQAVNEDGEFVWEKEVQGLVLGAFFWGYIVTQIPGGILAGRFGGKVVFLWAMVVAALATLLAPISAAYSPYLLMALRIITGLAQGLVFPCMHTIWSKWAPPLERSILTTVCYTGCPLGTVITFPVSAYICDIGGWSAVFYFFGVVTLVWCVAWYLIVSDSPSEHKRISSKELAYILESMEGQGTDEPNSQKKVVLPWKSIMTSGPVWAIAVAHTCGNFGGYLVLTSLPTYMKEVLNFNIKSNGLFSALPFLALTASANTLSQVADFLRRRKILSTTNVRKLLIAIAFCGQAVFMVAAGYSQCGQEMLAVAFLILSMTLNGAKVSGYMVNHVDIAPQHAGTLLGISNTFATIPGFVAPSVAAALTPNQSREEWQSVFWVALGVLLFGAVFYGIFGSGEIQAWALPPHHNPDPTLVPLHTVTTTMQQKQFPPSEKYPPSITNSSTTENASLGTFFRIGSHDDTDE